MIVEPGVGEALDGCVTSRMLPPGEPDPPPPQATSSAVTASVVNIQEPLATFPLLTKA
ncbi:MAG: hypothetical protein ACYDA5_04430 [Vulcanimicrobiaceae bacterium]